MRSNPSAEDLPTLFGRLADRDDEAFGEICRRFWAKLLVFARSRVRRNSIDRIAKLRGKSPRTIERMLSLIVKLQRRCEELHDKV